MLKLTIKEKINSFFSKKEKIAGALYPIDNIDKEVLKPYQNKLDKALADDQVKNIAISASYGVGKSSVLLSYFKEKRNSYNYHIVLYNLCIRAINAFKKKLFFSSNLYNEKIDYQFVSLPNFFQEEDNKDSSELQKEIVQQLLFNSPQRQFPYSKIKRINDRNILVDSIQILFWFFLIYIMTSQFQLIVDLVKPVKTEVLSLEFWAKMVLLIGGIIVWPFIVSTYRYIKRMFSKSTIKFGTSNLSFEKSDSAYKSDIDIFNLYQEELMYYFRKSDTKVVIFEDLDRFKNPQIFQDLRELNTNINKRNGKIVFIYSLRDSIFHEEFDKKNKKDNNNIPDEQPLNRINTEKFNESAALLKSKFFDYVIPVFPEQNYENTGNTIKNEIVEQFKSDEDNNENDQVLSIIEQAEFRYFIDDIGLYIKDLRTIKLIINEFKLYYDSLQRKNSKEKVTEKKLTIEDEVKELSRLIAMTVYKNLYPKDFEKINTDNSILSIFFNNRVIFIEKLYEEKNIEFNNKLEEINDEIKSLNQLYVIDLQMFLESLYMRYRKIIFKDNANSNSYVLSIGEKKYGVDSSLEFYQDLMKKTVDVPIMASYQSKPIDLDFFDHDGVSVKKMMQYVVDEDLRPIIEVQTTLYSERDAIESYKRELYNEIQRKTTGEIIIELEKSEADFSNFKKESLNEAYSEFYKYPLLRYLIFNNYITDNFKDYISKVVYQNAESNTKFLQHLKSHSVDFQMDYKLEDIPFIVQQLDRTPSNYYYAHSSDLFLYMMIQQDNIEKCKDILSNDIRYNRYELLDNAISKSMNNDDNIVKVMEVGWKANAQYFINYIEQISNDLERTKALIRLIVVNFKMFRFKNDYVKLINLIKVIQEKHLFLLFETILELNQGIEFDEKNDFLTEFRDQIKVEDISTCDKNYYDFVFRNSLYIASEKNFDYFTKFFKVENIFDDYYELLVSMGDNLIINYKDFFKYIEAKYSAGAYESYDGFIKYLKVILGQDTALENKQSKLVVSSVNKKEEYLLNQFDMIKLSKVNANKNRKVIEEIYPEQAISISQIEKLLANDRLYFHHDIWNEVNKNRKHIKSYLLMCMRIDQDVFQNNLEELSVTISFSTKLEMILLAENNNNNMINIIISKQPTNVNGDTNVLSQEELESVITKILNADVGKEFILLLISKLSETHHQSRVIEYVLDNNLHLNIKSSELDEALDTTVFSIKDKKGNTNLSYKDYNVSADLINILENRELAKHKTNNAFSVMSKLSEVIPTS